MMSSILNSEWVQWVKVVGMLILFALFVFTAWWALYADRPKGRQRCPKCWYDMSYSPGNTCAECGHTVHSAKELQRTRQRRGLALAGILGATLVGLYFANAIMARGWMSYVPNRVAIWLMPLAETSNGPVFTTLERRMRDDTLTEDQWLAVLERIVQGDGGAEPPSDEWIAKYGTLLNSWGRRYLTAGDEAFSQRVQELMMSVPPRVDVDTRMSWPVGVRPTVDVVARDWWPGRVHLRITAEPDAPGAVTDTHIRTRGPIQERSYSIYLPALEPGEHEIDVAFTFQKRRARQGDWEDAGSQVVTVPFTVEGELTGTLTPVSSDEMTEAIRECFNDGLVKYPSGNLPVRVGVGANETFIDAFDSTVVAVRVNVLRNGQLGRRLDIWWEAGPGRFDRQYAWEVPYWDDELLGAPNREDDEWVLHVVSMPELALRVKGVSRYWEGEVMVPVAVRASRRPAPSRGFVSEAGPEAPEGEEEVR